MACEFFVLSLEFIINFIEIRRKVSVNKIKNKVLLAILIFTSFQSSAYLRAGIAPVSTPDITGSAQGDTGIMTVNIPYTSGYVESTIVYTLNDGVACPPDYINKYQTTGSAGILYNYVTLNGEKYPITWDMLSPSYSPMGGVNNYTDYYTADQVGYRICTDYSGTGVTGQAYITPQIRGTVNSLPSNLSPGQYNITGHGYFGVYTSVMTNEWPYAKVINDLIKGGWPHLNRREFTIPVTYEAKCWYAGNLDFDYKIITMDKVLNSRLEKHLTINCNANTSAKVAIYPTKPPSGSYSEVGTAIGIGNNLDAIIDFAGLKNNDTLNLNMGSNTLNVSSTLKIANDYPAEGTYEGGGTVVVTLL